jgi:small subunit ribosomal protein S6
MLRQYETTIAIDAHLPSEKVDAVIEKYSKFIEKNKGKVTLIDRWGKRRLAYEIAKKQYGYYVYLRFEADATFIKELEREFKLDDAVLRYLIILIPRIMIKEEERRKSRSLKKRTEESRADAKKSDDGSSVEMPSIETGNVEDKEDKEDKKDDKDDKDEHPKEMDEHDGS